MAESAIDMLYEGGTVPVEVIDGSDGTVETYTTELGLSDAYASITEDMIAEKLEALNRPAEVVEADGYQFEFVRTRPADAPTNLFISTISSGATNMNGPGNMFEQAVRAVAKDRRAQDKGLPVSQYVYLSSPGNGQTSSLTAKELTEFKKSGRLIYEEWGYEVKAMPMVRALAKALKKKDMVVESIDTDSAGGVLGVAYGAWAGHINPGQIREMFQNGRPQVIGQSAPQIMASMLYENKYGTAASAHSGSDQWATTQARKEQAATALDKLLAGGSGRRINFKELTAWGSALRKGPSNNDPLFSDLKLLAHANPSVRLTMVHGSYDKFLSDSALHFWQNNYPNERMETMAAQLSAIGNVAVRLMTLPAPANHSWHTFFPGLREAAEDFAVTRL